MAKKPATLQKHISISKEQIIIRRTHRMQAVVAILSIVLLLMAFYLGTRAYKLYLNQVRLQQITAIYDSLQLSDDYHMDQMNLFGDKRMYGTNQPGRTFASSIVYGYNATPDDTRAELRKRAEAAGFTLVQTEYENSVQPIDEYRNNSGNYLRIGVMSRYVHDKSLYGNYESSDSLMNHANEAPSYVTIKVNLDDNNE